MDLPLDYIFIDTSVFKLSSYFKKDSHIHRLFDLAEKGYLTILMPAVTEKEWQKHIELAAQLKLQDIHRKPLIFGAEEAKDFLSKYGDIESDYESFMKEAFQSHMDRAKVVRLPINYPNDRLEKIFDLYFSKKKPFGPDGKNKEFPDAFALASLEKYAEENHIKRIIVFSNDNDMKDYESTVLSPKVITDFLNELTITRIPQFTQRQQAKADKDRTRLEFYFEKQPTVFLELVRNQIEDFLMDDTVYADRLDYSDVEKIHIEHLNISFQSSGMEILSIDEESIHAYIPIQVDSIVKVTHFDQENSIWDSEDKDFIIKFDTTTEIKITCECPVSIVYSRQEDLDTDTIIPDTDIEMEDVDLSNLQEAIDKDHPWYWKTTFKRSSEVSESKERHPHHTYHFPIVDPTKYMFGGLQYKSFIDQYQHLLNDYFPHAPQRAYEFLKAQQDLIKRYQHPEIFKMPDILKNAQRLSDQFKRKPGTSDKKK